MVDFSNILVTECGLPIRLINSLKNYGYYTMAEVAASTPAMLLRCPNLGRGGLQEIENWFFERGKLVGFSRQDLERQIEAMQKRGESLRKELERNAASIAHAKRRLMAGDCTSDV